MTDDLAVIRDIVSFTGRPYTGISFYEQNIRYKSHKLQNFTIQIYSRECFKRNLSRITAILSNGGDSSKSILLSFLINLRAAKTSYVFIVFGSEPFLVE